MTANQFLARMVAMLDRSGIAYMLAGSFASTFHGTPRTTQDADFIIDPTDEALDVLLSHVSQAGFYVDADRAHEALRVRRQFNVIDPDSGWKADLVIRKERPFSREELRRRVPAKVAGVDLFIASAEDTILSKLEWAARADSQRQILDVEGIVRARGPSLDRAYLERWAEDLGVLALWRRIE